MITTLIFRYFEFSVFPDHWHGNGTEDSLFRGFDGSDVDSHERTQEVADTIPADSRRNCLLNQCIRKVAEQMFPIH